MSRSRWYEFCARAGAEGPVIDAVYDDLAARYSEAHRAYHTMTHVEHCLDILEHCAYRAVDRHAIEAAIWFHDAVHDPGARDNEHRSSALARRTLVADMGLPRPFGTAVEALVLATRHGPVPDDHDARLLVDIDLAILGETRDRFDAYDAAIRREYAHVPDDVYVGRRMAVLLLFASRERIYATKHFRRRYEGQARANLRRAIARLRDEET